MTDPLIYLRCAYFEDLDNITVPDQSINEIIDFRDVYKFPKVERSERRNLQNSQDDLRWKSGGFSRFFEFPYAFYRIHRSFDSNSRFLCHPLHFETAFGYAYEHLSHIYISGASEDLLTAGKTTKNQLLIGDILAISNIYQLSNSNQYFAGEYVIFERRIEHSDSLIYRNSGKLLVSSSRIPMDRLPADFIKGIDLPRKLEENSHLIARCEIFIPQKGTQRFCANFVDDILHPDRNIRQACRKLHQYSHIYRCNDLKTNYSPLVTRWTAGNSFNREDYSKIGEILKVGSQKQVQQICSLVEASLAHFENMKNWLDLRNHPLEIVKWSEMDDFRIRIDFEVKDEAWKRSFPKKAMLRIYGIVPRPLDFAVTHHQPENFNNNKSPPILKCVLRILDNIDELREIDVESAARKLFFEVVDGIKDRPPLIYSHLIAEDERNLNFVRNFGKKMPDNVFNEIMRFWRNPAAPPQKFAYENNPEQKLFIKEQLRNMIRHEPTKQQTKSAYFSIHAANPLISIEAPVGGGKTTLLAAICCISAGFYDKSQLIVSESNGAIVSVCRKLQELGVVAKNLGILRITSQVAQRRNGDAFLTDFDLPTVAARVFHDFLMKFDEDPDKLRSPKELQLLARTYRMLNFMNQITTQTNFNFPNFEKLRNLIGLSIYSSPENPSTEQIKLVFELFKPKIILGTATQIEQLIENHKIALKIDTLFVDKSSVQSIFSLFSLVSMIGENLNEKFPKIVMIGDREQFKPLCEFAAIQNLFETSMKVIGNGVAQIKHQEMFRFSLETAKMLENVFYKNAENNMNFKNLSIDFEFIENSRETSDDERFMKNEKEAERIREKCEEFERMGIARKDVMILAFYNGQVNLLRRKLSRGYTVLTARSAQGLEAKIVLISVARTSHWKREFHKENNYLSSPITEKSEHILVSISRATQKSIVFIDREYCSKVALWSKISKFCT